MLEINMVHLLVTGAVLFTVGAILTYLIHNAYLKKQNLTAKDLLDSAQNEVEKQKKEQLIKFREEMQHKRNKFNEEFKVKENQLSREDSKLTNREKELRRLENNLKYKDSRYSQQIQKVAQREELLYEKHNKLDSIIDDQNKNLQSIAGISVDEAKKHLMENLESKVKLEAAQMAKDIKDEAKLNAQREAKEIIAGAIENLACDFTMEHTLSTVQIPNERFKGMIIGREGRNIRAFEDATGVKCLFR